MSASNVHNQGIMHWSPALGGRAACGSHRAIMATTGDKLKDWSRVCVKCQAKYDAAVAKETAPRQVGTIDLKPTYRACVPIIVAGIENGTPEGRRLAIEELYRMADFCDGKAVKS